MAQTQHTTITSSTAETTILAAGGAREYRNINRLVIANTSATACVVTIRDSTAGTIREVFAVAAGANAGFALPSKDAVSQTVLNSAWTATCGTSVASIEITVQYVPQVLP